MRTTFAYSFYCRKSKENKKGLAHVELSVSINTVRRFITLPYVCKPEDFNKVKKPKAILDYINQITNNINQFVLELSKEGMELNADNLSYAIINGSVKKTYKLSDLFKEYSDIMLGKGISVGQYKKYLSTAEFVIRAIGDKAAEELTNGDVMTVQNALYKAYAPNTAAGHMVRLKGFLRYAKDNNKISINPAANVRVRRAENSDIVILTDEEMDTLRTKDLHIERLNKVRDLWLFQAATGLSYCDMALLVKEDIKEENGTHYICKRRKKTGTQFTSVILKEGMDILIKYNYELPIVSNQKMNAYLSEIRDICGIQTKWTSHTARHMYCTRLLNAGVRMEVVAKCAGHSDIKTTKMFYAKLLDNTVVAEVSKLL